MKLKNQITMFAALMALAGCSPSEQSGKEKTADTTVAAKEAQPRPKEGAPATEPAKNAVVTPPAENAAPAAPTPAVPAPAPGQSVALAPKDYTTEAKDQ